VEGNPEHGGRIILVIGHDDVGEILLGREAELIEIARKTYLLHESGMSSLPHSTFLRFPGDKANRVIALPAFVGGDSPAAGMKWIASFPGNIDSGLPRASAAIMLNSLDTGCPETLIEGSLISAKRTAASAALAGTVLTAESPPGGVALIGCGVINFEVLRFLAAALPALTEVTLFDSDPDRAASFAQRCAELVPTASITVALNVERALETQDLVSIATTAAAPHMDLRTARPGSVVLHLSLRDIYPDTILHSHNVVDDVDHVCRERTSLHLAEMITYRRGFIDASLGQILRDDASFRRQGDRPVVFSPFGLGVLDIAVAEFVRTHARKQGLGMDFDRFLPAAAVPTAAAVERV
jgi:N-[(2S)-2-amino-2-carboxyethyl]-L-glutamate dehydrogenase